MSERRPTIRLVPVGGHERFQQLRLAHSSDWTLGMLLDQAPALFTEPVAAECMDLLLEKLSIKVLQDPLFLPPGMELNRVNGEALSTGHADHGAVRAKDSASAKVEDDNSRKSDHDAVQLHPEQVEERDAVVQAYAREIEKAASFLRAQLPVLIYCDKLVVEYLWREIVKHANKEFYLLEVPDDDESSLMPRSMRQRQLAKLKEMIRNLKKEQVLVIRHLDLLAGGNDANLPTESRELIELAYEASDRLILAFADRTLEVPEVLSARFAVKLLISGIPRTVITPDGEKLVGEALVKADEAIRFKDYDAEALYKNVAGMNPVRLRHGIRYAVAEYGEVEPVPVARLYEALRAFKVQTSARFEVPNIHWEDIGGFEEVKRELKQAISLILGSGGLDPKLRAELIPRGFLFHGPPGTGKTLFAKAVANQMNATIQVVSGPEVTDMYVGESERKVRELFAEARRNAPAVLVFDEFDSIASQRSGRDDGGSRAGNAIVAQILTEMDGFRPDVPMLVIGTTNRLDIIDEALLRPSRFKAVGIGLPDRTARRAIAKVHAEHFGISAAPELFEVLADSTNGMNGDEIRSVFRDARVAAELEGVTIDAHYLGRLVGQLRRSEQQKKASVGAHRTAPSAPARQGGRPGPSDSLSPATRSPTTSTTRTSSATAPVESESAVADAKLDQSGNSP